jgi:UDP-2,3-diacylglucosamine hydrolase
MSEKPFYIVSDTHLGAVPRSTETTFRRFLSHVRDHASGLLIGGDLFDFWFEYRTVIHSRHYRVLASLADLVDDGVPVWFVGGNHDWWGGEFLEKEVGITVLEGPVELRIGSRRALVAHGDGVGRGDIGYRALRWVLRNRGTVWAFRQLHPDWGSRIAELVSSTEEKTGHDPDQQRGRAEFVRAWAAQQMMNAPALDLVIAGHVHVPEVSELFAGRFYVNPGDWINHFSYVTVPAGAEPPSLHRWNTETY